MKTADAVVVGGGVIGLSIARELARRGMNRVVLIERGQLGAEASWAAGGMLAAQSEADEADAFLELALRSREMYTSFAARLHEETGIDVEFERTGTLYVAFTEEDEAEINRRYEWQTRAGLPVERLSAEEARRLEPCISKDLRAALRFPLDVQVENRRLIAALAASVEKYGVRLLTGTDAISLRTERGRIKGLITSCGEIAAPVVIIACGAWATFLSSTNGSIPRIHIEPVRGQMLCFNARPPVTRHVIYSPRGYLVPRMDGRLLAGSTTERVGFDKRVTARGLNTITTHALEIAPALSDLPLQDSWSGLRPRAEDDLPVLGPSAETIGLYFASGHYRNGILLAPITAELIADAVMTGTSSSMLGAFSPDRFTYCHAH